MRNVLRGIGSIIISAGILWLLLRETGQSAQEGLQALWTMSLGVWLVYGLAQLLQGWLRAIRYRVLLAGAKANPLPSPARMFGVTLARNMFVDMLPERSIVLTQNPTMFLLWRQNAIQTYAGINNPDLIKTLFEKYQGHVYFHHNYWCNTKNKRNIRLCQDIRERYELEKIAEETEQDYRYGIFKMKSKDSP